MTSDSAKRRGDRTSPFLCRIRRTFENGVRQLIPLLLVFGLGCTSTRPTAQSAQAEQGKGASIELVTPPFSTTEACYNAWDDNHNGLIDEGCGVVQSQIQVVLAWQDAESDIDLQVYDPKGEVVTPRAPTASGMALLMDCPSDDNCIDPPFEIVYSEADEYLGGRYRVRLAVRQGTLRQAAPGQGSLGQKNLVAQLGVRTPERTWAYRIQWSDRAQGVDIDFSVAEPSQRE